MRTAGEVETQQTVTKKENKTVMVTYVKVTARRAPVHAYPTQSAKILERLTRGDERQSMSEDNSAPKEWVPVKAADGTAGWLRIREVELGTRQKTVPYEKSHQVTVKKTVTAFHFGKPTYGEQLKTFYPLWWYFMAGLAWILMMLICIMDKRSGLFILATTVLLATSGHLIIQTINFAVMHFWGTPLSG